MKFAQTILLLSALVILVSATPLPEDAKKEEPAKTDDKAKDAKPKDAKPAAAAKPKVCKEDKDCGKDEACSPLHLAINIFNKERGCIKLGAKGEKCGNAAQPARCAAGLACHKGLTSPLQGTCTEETAKDQKKAAKKEEKKAADAKPEEKKEEKKEDKPEEKKEEKKE